jgi:hypothetical protein
VYRRLQDEWSLIKALPIRVRIFDVCQEHLTSFNPGDQAITFNQIQALKPSNDHDHQKH